MVPIADTSKRPSNSLCRVRRTHAISRCQTNGRGDQVGESHYDSVAGASFKRAAISSYEYFAMPDWRRGSRSQMALADSECATYWLKSEHLGAASRPVRRSRVFESKYSRFEFCSDQGVILRVTGAARFVKNTAQC